MEMNGYDLQMMKRDSERTFVQRRRYKFRGQMAKLRQTICRMYNRSLSSGNTSILISTGLAAPLTIAFA